MQVSCFFSLRKWLSNKALKIHQPLRNKETVLDEDSDDEKQKSLNDHHENISSCNIPTERISNKINA